MKINYAQLSNKKSKIFEKFYDFIIIGSGPAGVTLYKDIKYKGIVK